MLKGSDNVTVFTDKQIKSIVTFVCASIAVLILLFILPKAIEILLPFIFAAIISVIISPLVNLLEKRLRFPRALATILTMIIALALLGLLIFTVAYQGVYYLQELADKLPSMLYSDFDFPDWIENINNMYFNLPIEVKDFIAEVEINIKENLIQILQPATKATITFAKNIAVKLPSIFIFTVILLLSVFFISYDKNKISYHIRKSMPEKIKMHWYALIKSLKLACGGYIRAQLIIMTIVFTILLLGFTILDVKTAVLFAFIIAVIDVIPILGTGTVLWPWAIISLLQTNYKLAVGLIIIYLVVLLTRQFIEPKIVGSQIGLHPLATLLTMYTGYKLIGVFGMILGPIIAILVISLVKASKQIKEEDIETT